MLAEERNRNQGFTQIRTAGIHPQMHNRASFPTSKHRMAVGRGEVSTPFKRGHAESTPNGCLSQLLSLLCIISQSVKEGRFILLTGSVHSWLAPCRAASRGAQTKNYSDTAGGKDQGRKTGDKPFQPAPPGTHFFQPDPPPNSKPATSPKVQSPSKSPTCEPMSLKGTF